MEVDETYIGREPGGYRVVTGGDHKMKVLSLVDRNSRQVRSFVMDNVNSRTVGEIVAANMAKEARLLTNQATCYLRVGATFADHKSVNHSKEEYVSRLDPSVHTNTVEGFYSIFKRGMKGVYQHCGKNTFTATWPSLTSAIAIGSRTALTTDPALRWPFRVW